ncbi:unnamed protein product [Medioppia subpectinata]|uniref:Uncharacterized protein n=1 Tax=Medioppia subpectinata TaxID=1979941 RepID=A0A7R9KE45_9ACAR|nr:unnamed protein product [Medioppia subpectinata]CAG2100465.1 unnamed protein product [Medioppia subpectinata]
MSDSSDITANASNTRNTSPDGGHKVVFKKKTRFGQQRRQMKTNTEDESQVLGEEEDDEWKRLHELKQTQHLRKRSNKGIDILELTQNPIVITNTNKTEIKGGITSDVKTLTNELDLGNTFSVETNRRDEDTDLMKYIEEELSRRKGKQLANTDNKSSVPVNVSNDMNVLFDVLPEHLIQTNAKKSEEMLSNQMLNGIPEIELGLEEKIRNIEATEEAKSKLMVKRNNRWNEGNASSFVPNNIAVCFVQHNRYNLPEDVPRLSTAPKRVRVDDRQQTQTYVDEPVVVIGDEPKQKAILQNNGSDRNHNKFYGKDKASDDYIFEKFKKQFRKF